MSARTFVIQALCSAFWRVNRVGHCQCIASNGLPECENLESPIDPQTPRRKCRAAGLIVHCGFVHPAPALTMISAEIFSVSLSVFTLISLAALGDKSQWVCMTLAARHRRWPIHL